MESHWVLVLLLLHVIPRDVVGAGAAIGVGVGVGIGNAGGGGVGGGGGIWIGGGNNAPPPSGPASSTPKLAVAYTALQAWKSAIEDDPSGIMRSWVGSDVCAYQGVFCADSKDGIDASLGPVVAGIDLNHGNLKGILVNELSLLTDMSLLHLNSNRFSGTVPETFRDLSSLQELDLSNNLLSGLFPTVTLDIPNLVYMDIRFNKFAGPIPADLFSRNLDAIFLNNNNFEGPLPFTLGSSQASVINLANNKFSGNLPASFGYTGSRVKEILFLNNQLTGCIPEGVGLFTEIEVLDVSANSFVGQLPNSISCLQGLEVLNLAHNKLSGHLPDLVCSLKSLANLTVAYNFFSGFNQECANLFVRNVGFDFVENCIPGWNMQRPRPECSAIPGISPSCMRTPVAQPFLCDALRKHTVTSPGSTSP